eukprot:TRINITY_DN881_c2_g1_i1.p1 TRINITY_DN881_c2_g1~~TRINITY_DN881_c2_g1_i1.p1  ORF type:complete len:332 (+),score=51.67 TRINITY_DN881_c2_g1_i1:67-1062(+)
MVATAVFVGLSEPAKPASSGGWKEKVRKQRKEDNLRWDAYRESVAGSRLAKFSPMAATPTPTKPSNPQKYRSPLTGKRVFVRKEGGWVNNFHPTTVNDQQVKRHGDRDPLPRWKQKQQPVQTKPNLIPSSVGKNSYPSELQAPTLLSSVRVDRVIRSGLDFDEQIVPLYSSFSPDNKFIDPLLRKLEAYKIENRKTKPRDRDDAAPLLDLVDELTQRRDRIRSAAASVRRIREEDEAASEREKVVSRPVSVAQYPVAPALPRGASVLGDGNPASMCPTPTASSPFSILAPTPGPSTSAFSSKLSTFTRPTAATPTAFFWDRFTPVSETHDH